MALLNTMEQNDKRLISEIKAALATKKHLVKRRANGALKHDYLVPGGFYKEQWDWDAFFMGVALAAELPSEAIYLRNWALNYFATSDKNGYAPGCITPKGPETGHRAFTTKPFIAQGTYLASKFLEDFSWIKPYYATLLSMVTYRERHLWNREMDLPVWGTWVESGADNNPSILDFPGGTIVAADASTFVLRNYKAMSLIAKELGKKQDAAHFAARAETVKKNMLRYLWDTKDRTFYNFNPATNDFIRHHTYSNLVPLWEKVPAQKEGGEMIKRYVINPKKLWSRHGIRTLAADDILYNQKNIIFPYSNWQGPVWPICNYLHMHGLLQYGFQKEAIEVARRITKICLSDIKKTGGMHEDYHAETGVGLAGPNFISWNLLVGNMLEEAHTKTNPFFIS